MYQIKWFKKYHEKLKRKCKCKNKTFIGFSSRFFEININILLPRNFCCKSYWTFFCILFNLILKIGRYENKKKNTVTKNSVVGFFEMTILQNMANGTDTIRCKTNCVIRVLPRKEKFIANLRLEIFFCQIFNASSCWI